ncbi:type VI secretion system Vgr family protein, partial [Erwinia sp. OLTSP20]|uniref:type VI secretion system Vgr family protein n=1 Tax=Erwinia sp. OLTSP20 TaxID=1912857 RepID=UPI00406C7FBC
MSRTITLETAAMPFLLGEPALVLFRVEGEEALSTLYSYKLTCKTPDNPKIPWQSAANIDMKALIGKEMTVVIELDGNGLDQVHGVGKGKREISGIVEKACFIGRDANQAMYEIIIRPWLYLATLTKDFKIFQDKTVVDIIDEVLQEYNFPTEKRLSAVYPSLNFQVQYGESDFDFIERLMEEWGIYWFFEHQDQKHRLVMVDHVGAHKAYFSEAYRVIEYLPDSPKAGAEYISQFYHKETLVSSRWVTNDYDFTKSRADIMALDTKPRRTSFNSMEIYSWPGDYDQPSIGEQLARIRIEEIGAKGSRASGSGEVRGIVCGTNFELKGYPVSKVNREYMVISSRLLMQEVDQGARSDQFSVNCFFTVQPTSKIYRHPQVIPRPRTHGPQSAIVVGPPGEEVWTDTYGRVKVRFVWDRYGKNREDDSCWVRVSQAWAGNGFGGIYIPRVGQEVIIEFINGDPDRPLIMGSLYNNVTQPPWDLPTNSTQSGMISRTIGGGYLNYNGVRFEDKPGLETYWEQAERDMLRLTKNNESQTVGVNSTIFVGNNRDSTIGGDLSEHVTRSSSYVVGADTDYCIFGSYNLAVGVNFSASISGLSTTLIGGCSSLQVAAAYNIAVGGAYSLNVGGAIATNVGGAHLTNAGGYCGTTAGGAWQATAGGAATLFGAGFVSVGAGGELVLSAKVIRMVAKDAVIIQGGVVNINPGDNDDCCGGGGGGLSGLAALAGLVSLRTIPLIDGCPGLPTPLPPLPTPTPPPTPTHTQTPTLSHTSA